MKEALQWLCLGLLFPRLSARPCSASPWNSSSAHAHTSVPRACSHGRHTCPARIILARSTIISLGGLLLKEGSICTLKCRFCFLSCDDLLLHTATTTPSQQISVREGRTAFGVSQADPNSLTKASGWEHPARRTSKMLVAQGQIAPGNFHLRSNVCTAAGMFSCSIWAPHSAPRQRYTLCKYTGLQKSSRVINSGSKTPFLSSSFATHEISCSGHTLSQQERSILSPDIYVWNER